MGRTVISPSQYRCEHSANMENTISDEEKTQSFPSPAHSLHQHQQREQQSTSFVRGSSLKRNSSRHSHFTLSQPNPSLFHPSSSSSSSTTNSPSSNNHYSYKPNSNAIPGNSTITQNSHSKVRLKILQFFFFFFFFFLLLLLDHALYLGK